MKWIILKKQHKIAIDTLFYYKTKHKEFIKKNKLILKIQQRSKSEKNKVFDKEIIKIHLDQMMINKYN